MKRALITGASSGIGKELSIALAQEGFSLTLTGRNEAALKELYYKLAKITEIEYFVCDLADSFMHSVVAQKLEEDSFDLIINNAAFSLYGEACELDLVAQLEMVDVNVKALLSISVIGARAMSRASRSGVIVNISSAASFLPTPNMSVYGATKAFVTSFSQSLDYEMRPKGIRVLTVCPGMVATEFAKKAAKKDVGPLAQMRVDKAVKEILWQIKRKKRLYIFGKRVKWALFMVKLVPKSLSMRMIYNNIKKRL